MKRLITMTLSFETDGENHRVFDDTHIPEGVTWAEAYQGMIALRDELNRQIQDRKLCPFNPMNVRNNGEPEFDT